jgi:hypothetical protein
MKDFDWSGKQNKKLHKILIMNPLVADKLVGYWAGTGIQLSNFRRRVSGILVI